MAAARGALRASAARRVFQSQDGWRNHPILTNTFEIDAFAPGLKLSAAIFAGYLALDAMGSALSPEVVHGGICSSVRYEKSAVGEAPTLAED